MTVTISPTPDTARRRQWWWFSGVLTVLTLLGAGIAIVAILPLAMATDPCHTGSTDWVCTLTGSGQVVLVFTPWLWLAGGILGSIIGAVVATRLRRTPLLGILVGIFAYIFTVPLSMFIAGLV